MSCSWINDLAVNAGGGVLAAIAIGVFAYIRARVPDISGVWTMTVTVRESDRNPFKGMKLTYIVMLAQRGGAVSGNAEKVYEVSIINPCGYHYQKSARMQSDISGGVLGNVFQSKNFQLLFKESGLHRPYISTVNLRVAHATLLVGTYQSTAANSSGTISMTKRVALYGYSFKP